jgi:60S ribosomal subunit assembly/export protein LOC1
MAPNRGPSKPSNKTSAGAKKKSSSSSAPSSSNRVSKSKPSSKSGAKRPPPKEVKSKARTAPELRKKKKVREYTEEELALPRLNMITPVSVQKPRGKKKGKVFVDDTVRTLMSAGRV